MVVYCTAQQVAEFLQKDNFSETTTPTQTVVEDFILRNETYIEQRTGHAWQTRTVTEEFVDNPKHIPGLGNAFYLRHRTLTTFTSGTDTINIFDGNTDIEYVANKTEGRNSDYYVDKVNGVVYIRDRNLFYPKGNRFKYRYGESSVDKDIEKACILLTAREILLMNDKTARLIDDGPSNRIPHDRRIAEWEKMAEDILVRKKEFITV